VIKPDRTSSTTNYSHVRPRGEGVVIHATRSGVAPLYSKELEGTLNHFANPYPTEPHKRASAHWVIGRNGQKVRVVADDMEAWHAGQHNITHFGIELEQAVEGDGFTDVQMAALVEVCKGYVADFGIPANHAMRGFIGHEETPQGKGAGKSDPGKLFPWDWFIVQLRPPVEFVPDEIEIYKTLLDAGHFTSQGWNLADIDQWQKDTLDWLNRKAHA
jgi:hypothetical protein